jgi:hypothetical protein
MKISDRPARAIALALVALLLPLALGGCALAGDDQSASVDSGLETRSVGGEELLAEEYYEGEVAADSAEAIPPGGTGEDATLIAAEDRLIILTRSMRIEVDDVKESVEDIRAATAEYSGIITSLNVASDSGPVYYYDEYGTTAGSGAALAGWITVRVPGDQVEEFVDTVAGLGEVKWESATADDVTQEAVDLEARLANLKAEEERLRSFFDAADTVEEMLLIEQELNRVRQEIESLTAQIAYLERQAAMATVTIELSEPEAVVQPAGPDWGFARAVTTGLQLAAAVVNAAIVISIGSFGIVPLIIVVAIILIVRALVRARKSRKAREEAEKTAGGPDDAS